MALGAVEIGIMNPIEAPSVAPRAGSIGRSPATLATAITIGIIMFADAVLEVVSDSTIAAPVKRAASVSDVCDGNHAVRPWPIAAARPLENVLFVDFPKLEA